MPPPIHPVLPVRPRNPCTNGWKASGSRCSVPTSSPIRSRSRTFRRGEHRTRRWQKRHQVGVFEVLSDRAARDGATHQAARRRGVVLRCRAASAGRDRQRPHGHRPTAAAANPDNNVLFARKGPVLSIETLGPHTITVGKESAYEVSIVNREKSPPRIWRSSSRCPTGRKSRAFKPAPAPPKPVRPTRPRTRSNGKSAISTPKAASG